MKWVKTEFKFTYNGKPVTRRKAIINTPVGQFKVYEAVGGNVFYTHPFLVQDPADPYEELSTRKIRCESLEEGMRKCESIIEKLKTALNNL